MVLESWKARDDVKERGWMHGDGRAGKGRCWVQKEGKKGTEG